MAGTHENLPLPDYDHVTVGALPAAIAPLTADEVAQRLGYERMHGDRLPVTTVLEHRLEALRGGAAPSDGDPTAARPETNVAPAPSGVSPATSGPPMNPPSQGVPTNPAQPR